MSNIKSYVNTKNPYGDNSSQLAVVSSEPNKKPDKKPDTFSLLAADIADEVDDSQGVLTVQIEKSILAAIRYCEREHYYFNETRDLTFKTITNQAWYGENDVPLLKYVVGIRDMFCEELANSPIRRFQPGDLESFDDKATGIPDRYAYFNRKIRLFPIPSSDTYTIRMLIAPVRLGNITDWFSEACDMIKARAKYNLYKNYTKEADLAQEALNDFNDERQSLRAETSRRNATGKLRVTRSY